MSKACTLLTSVIATLLAAVSAHAFFWPDPVERQAQSGVVYSHPLESFSAPAYAQAVEWMLAAFEEETGKSLAPGGFRKAGIKIYTNSGEGMSTPPELVSAVIEALEQRGFTREELFIVDAKEGWLRDSGFLAPLSVRFAGPFFAGVRVFALDEGHLWDETWFYDNPLPVQFSSPLGQELLGDLLRTDDSQTRKSFLARPFLTEVDFWINLPVATDHRAMGINGVMANATLWNVSNRERFFVSPANAPIAMAEIAAIPELLGNWAFNILSLEAYQYIGGPGFNSYYTRTEPLLLGSSDPAILDTLMVERMNKFRAEDEFPLLEYPPASSVNAEILGVGISQKERIRWVRPPSISRE